MSNPHTDSSTSPCRLIIHGASGRVGRRLCDLALNDPRFCLVAGIVHNASPSLGRALAPAHASSLPLTGISASAPSAEVVLDFSHASGVRNATELAVRLHSALLVGTTGLDAPTTDALRAAAREIPVLLAPNTSPGVALLADLAEMAARTLGPAFHASIVEAHHIHKKDAPSGTAKRLAAAIASAGEQGPTMDPDQVLSLRGGDVVGEHTIRFAGDGEYLELTHRATSRDLFAHGALRAALWLRAKPAGWYSIEQTLR
ncbi:MAG: 4-hydroxy-tetrahydrodipicolinate reductase [Phycisphaerales bacterium]